MSKERELLALVLSYVENKYLLVHEFEMATQIDETFIGIQELLAQPEQEPVAWMPLSDIEWMNIVNAPKILELTNDRHDSEEAVNLAVKMTEEKCKENNSRPKREPLTGKEISQGFRADKNANNAESYWAGVALAEKHYGVKINED